MPKQLRIDLLAEKVVSQGNRCKRLHARHKRDCARLSERMRAEKVKKINLSSGEEIRLDGSDLVVFRPAPQPEKI